jgi:hypothetical protein
MKKTTLPNQENAKDYKCKLFGHKFILIKKVNSFFKEYECNRCKLQVTNDPEGQKIKLTSNLKEINETLFYLHLKREFLSRFYLGNKP